MGETSPIHETPLNGLCTSWFETALQQMRQHFKTVIEYQNLPLQKLLKHSHHKSKTLETYLLFKIQMQYSSSVNNQESKAQVAIHTCIYHELN